MTPNPSYFPLKQIKAHGLTKNKFSAIGSHPNQSRSHIQYEVIAIHVHPCHQLNSSAKNYKRSSTTTEVACLTFKLFTSPWDKPSHNIWQYIQVSYFNYNTFFLQFYFYFSQFLFQVSYSFIFMKIYIFSIFLYFEWFSNWLENMTQP